MMLRTKMPRRPTLIRASALIRAPAFIQAPALIRAPALIYFAHPLDPALIQTGAYSSPGAYSGKYGIPNLNT